MNGLSQSLVFGMVANKRHRVGDAFKMVCFSLVLCVLAGCGANDGPVGDAQTLDGFLSAASSPAGTSNALLSRGSGQTVELVQNGVFNNGAQFWTEGSNGARAKYPEAGAVVSALPSGIALPVTANTNVARLCNFPGQWVGTSGGTTSTETTNCLDRLNQDISIPPGTQTLTLRVSAYADYAGCSTAKLVFGLKAGSITLRPSLSLTSTNLSAGAWTDFAVDVDASTVTGGSNATLSIFGTVGPNTVAEKFCSTQQNVNLLISSVSLVVKN